MVFSRLTGNFQRPAKINAKVVIFSLRKEWNVKKLQHLPGGGGGAGEVPTWGSGVLRINPL